MSVWIFDFYCGASLIYVSLLYMLRVCAQRADEVCRFCVRAAIALLVHCRMNLYDDYREERARLQITLLLMDVCVCV